VGFLIMVMYAPGGFASLLMMNLRIASFGLLGRLWPAYLALLGTAATAVAGVAVMVEMLYHIKLNEALGPQMSLMGIGLDTGSVDAWLGAVLLLAAGVLLFELSRRHFLSHWEQTQEEIETELRRRAAL